MSSYSRERLEVFNTLLKRKSDIRAGRPCALEPRDLRFKHGETIPERKVPFHMGGEDETCIEQAVLGLTSLLIRRYEPKTEGAKEGAPLIITTGVLKDKARAGDEERTSYLALLALMAVVRKKKEKVKGFRIKGLSYEKAELAIGLVMSHAIRTAILDIFSRLRESGATYYHQSAETLLLSAVTPRSFLSIPSNLASGTLNPYGVNSETLEAVSAVPPSLDEFDGSPGAVARPAAEVKNNSSPPARAEG